MGVRRNELYHHGVKGQKWGVRRYEYENGGLTPEGKKKQAEYNQQHAGDARIATRKSRLKKLAVAGLGAAAAAGGAYLAYKKNVNVKNFVDRNVGKAKLRAAYAIGKGKVYRMNASEKARQLSDKAKLRASYAIGKGKVYRMNASEKARQLSDKAKLRAAYTSARLKGYYGRSDGKRIGESVKGAYGKAASSVKGAYNTAKWRAYGISDLAKIRAGNAYRSVSSSVKNAYGSASKALKTQYGRKKKVNKYNTQF